MYRTTQEAKVAANRKLLAEQAASGRIVSPVVRRWLLNEGQAKDLTAGRR